MVIEQIKAQLDRLVPVHRVRDLTEEGPHVGARDGADQGDRHRARQRVEALRIADTFRARVVDTTIESFVFEMTGATDKLNAFIELMRAARPGRGLPHRGRRASRAAHAGRSDTRTIRPRYEKGPTPCASITIATPT